MVQSIDDARRRQRSSGAAGRVPPHNLQAEESLLGAMLLSRDAIAAVAEVHLSGDDFYKPTHGHIFEAIQALYERGDPADPVTVAEELRRDGMLDAIGGPAVLVSLQANTPATSNALRYARIVEEHALLRKLIAVAGEIAEIGYELPDDVTAAIDRAESMVFDIAQHRVSDSLAPLRDLLSANLDRLEALYERGESITGIPTGYIDLDEQLSGLQPSALVVVGARPAMGKCVKFDTAVVDPRTGARRTIEALYREGIAGGAPSVLSLGPTQRNVETRPSAFVDDGVKPCYRVRTRLGREVVTTLTHPFLTPTGWRPLAEIDVGTRIAVPGVLPVFGDDPLADEEVKLLGHLLGDGSTWAGTPHVTNRNGEVLAEVRACVEALGGRLDHHRTAGGTRTYRVSAGDGPNPVADLLRRHGLMGVARHAMFVPEAVFRLPRRQVALFLSRLFATDATASWTPGGGGRIAYCSVSRTLIHDVGHLLLRFGVNARIRRRLVAARGERRPAFELEIVSGADIAAFAEEIGIFSKEEAVCRLAQRIGEQGLDPAAGARSADRCGAVLATSGARAWAGVSAATRAPNDRERHPSARGPRRDPAACPAPALDDHAPARQAGSDIYWDTVVSIGYDGEHRVYDLTVPEVHNFVANDVYVHNTAFALGLAAHAALEQHRPVLLFSLEMGHLELTQRLLCAEARVDSNRMRNGRLQDGDWAKINNAIGRLAEAPIFIDDNPNLTVMEMRAKARRLKSREGDLGLIVVDYLQLMSGRNSAENRQVEVSEMSRGLKILARELEVPVVALSQLSRALEMRADKRPMLADLRESGCLTADTRILRADTGAEVTIGALCASGERDVPVWTLDEHWRLVAGTMTHAFPSGTKPVFRLRLASGREVKATANHPFRTLDGWTALGDLTVGSRVAVPRRVEAPEHVERWPEAALVRLARRLGGGCDGVHQPAAAALDDEAGHGSPSPAAGVPDAVFALADAQVALFLRHLWAAGGAVRVAPGARDVRVWLATPSRRLADDIRTLLLRFGIRSRVGPAPSGDGPGYHLHVVGLDDRRRFLERIGVHGAGEALARASAALRRAAADPDVDTLPAEARGRVAAALARAGMSPHDLAAALGDEAGAGSPLGWRADGAMPRRRVAALAEMAGDKALLALAAGDVSWDTVVAIEPLGEEPVFDATVVGTHNFVANGVIVHNSIEQDADVVMFIYRDEVYNPESADRGIAEIIVAKHRNGPTGTCRLTFLPHYTKFANMARGV